jgi:hypothetical protein
MTCCAPFGESVPQTSSGKSSFAQNVNRFKGKETVRTSTVGDDLHVRRELAYAPLEFGKRDRHRARNMTRAELLHGPHIEDEYGSRLRALDQFLAADGLEPISRGEVVSHDAIDLGEVPLRQHPDQSNEIEYLVIYQAIVDVKPPLVGLHQARVPERQQVVGCIGHGQRRLSGKCIDGSLTLSENLQKLQAPAT